MKNPLTDFSRLVTTLLAVAMLAAATLAGTASAADAGKIRVMVVTGGHGYERPQFTEMFRSFPDVSFEIVEHPKVDERLRPESAAQLDVLVLYDHWQEISPETKTNFLNFLKAGKGLVALHHSLCDYQDWPAFEQIVGGKYYLSKQVVKGIEKPQSTYKEGLDIPIHMADADHPVTRGVKDFVIFDETYGRFEVSPDVHVLLTTDAPTSTKVIGWAKTYDRARVVYLQSGHGHQGYENPNYRRLVAQAIRWTAHRE